MERFELRLPTAQREQLDELAAKLSLSSADVARIGVHWVLKHRDVLTDGPAVERERAA
jgi:hypothetical protein